MHRWAAGSLAFVTSGAVLVMEIIAGRLLAPYVGVTLQTYTAIIGVVLAGISGGTWLGGRLADRVDPRRALGPVLIVGGGLVVGSLPMLRLVGRHADSGGPTWAVVLATVAFLPGAAVLSTVSPLLVKLSLSDLERTGREVGRISALSTAGAIVGTFVSGFLLVATLPSTAILVGVGVALMAMGVGVWAVMRPFSGRLPVASLLVAGAMGAALPGYRSRCDVETAYFCARVEVDPGNSNARILWLDTLEHSYVDLTDDTRLEFGYTQAIGGVVDTQWKAGRPIRALHVGGGGYTIPRYVRATRPGSTNLVLERDPELTVLAERRLGLRQGNGLTSKAGDGRVTVRRQSAGDWDLVVGDAFGGEAVPWHLATREFTAEVAQRLNPKGIYALNIIDGRPRKFVRAEVATVAAVFRHVAVVSEQDALDGGYASNFVVVASQVPIDIGALTKRYVDIGLDVTVLTGAPLSAWTGAAKVLVDRFAPVDQLLTTD